MTTANTTSSTQHLQRSSRSSSITAPSPRRPLAACTSGSWPSSRKPTHQPAAQGGRRQTRRPATTAPSDHAEPGDAERDQDRGPEQRPDADLPPYRHGSSPAAGR